SDHQPRYEDILAERMKSSETPGGLALNQGLAPPDSGRGLSIGWNYPLANGVTSGPVASLRSDVTAPTVRSAGEAGYVNTLGWRMDYQALWGVHPWAQVSYNQSLASDVWAPMTRAREGGWSDVTLGADMRLGSHVAAWATLSQADNLPSGENTLYLMGVSANF
ncbi:TPA: autotransporter outer membrane beta-barrel domain-containing protein, partial [Klebsiella pneumoniae]